MGMLWQNIDLNLHLIPYEAIWRKNVKLLMYSLEPWRTLLIQHNYDPSTATNPPLKKESKKERKRCTGFMRNFQLKMIYKNEKRSKYVSTSQFMQILSSHSSLRLCFQHFTHTVKCPPPKKKNNCYSEVWQQRCLITISSYITAQSVLLWCFALLPNAFIGVSFAEDLSVCLSTL